MIHDDLLSRQAKCCFWSTVFVMMFVSFRQPRQSCIVSLPHSLVSLSLSSSPCTLIIYHSTLSLQAQNLPFQQILPTLTLLPWTAFTITGPDRTYHASRFIFSSFFSLILLFLPCSGLSWLRVSFLLHVKYAVSYRIVNFVTVSNIKTVTAISS